MGIVDEGEGSGERGFGREVVAAGRANRRRGGGRLNRGKGGLAVRRPSWSRAGGSLSGARERTKRGGFSFLFFIFYFVLFYLLFFFKKN